MGECMNIRLEVTKRKLTYKRVAAVLGISERALRDKINGKSDFTWSEADTLHHNLFPDTNKDELLARTRSTSNEFFSTKSNTPRADGDIRAG